MPAYTKLTVSAALTAVGLLIFAGQSLAQLDQSDLQILKEEGQADGWTFEVNRNAVTDKPLTSLCTLEPPPDWEATARFDPMLPPDSGQLGLPASYDWRTQDGCTAVRNQGGCGSCWAFSTVGALECAIRIKTGVSADLSEQYLVSCNRSGWSCNGGWFAHAYHYDTTGKDGRVGAVMEASKPYTATNGTCTGPYSHPYVINSWAYIDGTSGTVPSTNAIKQAILTYGPVSAAVYVNSAFQAYTSGVFNACTDASVNHAIVLVGWDDTDQAWILRNSWSAGWGESGYMRIRYGCCRVGYGACYVNYGASDTGPTITTPTPGSTLTDSSATFGWSADSSASEYWLNVGTALNKSDIYCKSTGTSTSATVDKLPVNGKPIYVKVYAKISGLWYGWAATYTAATQANAAAEMSSPTSGSTLDAGPVTFQWSEGTNVAEYKLWVGTASGISNLYNKSQGLSTSVTLSNLPSNGKPLYVALWSRIGKAWLKKAYTYTAATATPDAAEITSPTNGSTLSSSTATFAWDTGTGATEYSLNIGTAVGGKTVFNKAMGQTRTITINGLATNGSTLYVRLWSKCNGTWQYKDYTYVTPNLTRGAAEMTSPTNGATLTSQTATFAWSTGTGVTEYTLMIGTKVGGATIYNKSRGMERTATVTGLPIDGLPIYVRLCSRISGVLQKKDYVYTAATMTAAAAELTSPTPGGTLTSSLVTFTWSAGTAVAEYKLSIGTVLGGATLYNASLGTSTSATVANLPTTGQTLYVRLWSRVGATWLKKDYTFKAAQTLSTATAELTSPQAGSALSSTSVSFAWTSGVGAAEYWLSIGTTPSGKDLYDQSAGTSQSATVTNLPADGSTIYVRLSTKCSGTWQYRDYTFKTMTK